MITSRMSERLSSSRDWVDSTIAALCFRQVLRASTTYRWMLGFFKNTHASSMQNVEKQRFQKFRVLAHALEVEALKAGERDCVLGVVEEESELALSGPFRE